MKKETSPLLLPWGKTMLFRKFAIVTTGLGVVCLLAVICSELWSGEARISLGYSGWSSSTVIKFSDHPFGYSLFMFLQATAAIFLWRRTIAEHRYTEKYRSEIEAEENREPD